MSFPNNNVNPQDAARRERYAHYQAEQKAKAAAQVEDEKVAEHAESVTREEDKHAFFADSKTAKAYEDARATSLAGGASELEAREAAEKAARDTAFGNDTADVTDMLTGKTDHDVAAEVRQLREQLIQRERTIAPEETLNMSDTEYFEARKAGKIRGIRRESWGL